MSPAPGGNRRACRHELRRRPRADPVRVRASALAEKRQKFALPIAPGKHVLACSDGAGLRPIILAEDTQGFTSEHTACQDDVAFEVAP